MHFIVETDALSIMAGNPAEVGASMGGGLLGRAVDTATAAAQALDPREPDDFQVPNLDGKTAIVTGGNSGVHAAEQCAAWQVLW